MIMKKIKELKYIDAFLFVVNSEDIRFTETLKKAFEIFIFFYGVQFLKNSMLVFSKWANN